MTSCSVGGSLTTIINYFTCLLSSAVLPFLVTLAIVAFVYGIIQFFLNPDNEEKRKQGKSYMVWGIIALFVMVTVWGLVGILKTTFFGSGSIVTPPIPVVPGN